MPKPKEGKLYWCYHMGWFPDNKVLKVQSIKYSDASGVETEHELLNSGELEICPVCGEDRPAVLMIGSETDGQYYTL